nr:hypothetical protein [Luteimonas suaedae]
MPSPINPLSVDEIEHFAVGGHHCRGQVVQRFQYLLALMQIVELQFADHEGMRQHLPGFEQMRQHPVARTQMVDPDRGVCEDHAARCRRRDTGARSGSLPQDAQGDERSRARSGRAVLPGPRRIFPADR